MPSKSAKQQKFMTAVANNPKFAKEVGVPQSVGRKFDMPYGPGTYGSKVGRPPKKYRGGGGMGRSMMAAPGAGKASQGVRKCKYVSMKGS